MCQCLLYPLNVFDIVFAGLSDLSSATPQPMFSIDMQNSLKSLHCRARELRDECRHIRRLQMVFAETMRETINDTYRKIKVWQFRPLCIEWL